MEPIMDLISNLISTVGFPIACCVYMMVNNNKTLKELTTAVETLTVTVQALHGYPVSHPAKDDER